MMAELSSFFFSFFDNSSFTGSIDSFWTTVRFSTILKPPGAFCYEAFSIKQLCSFVTSLIWAFFTSHTLPT